MSRIELLAPPTPSSINFSLFHFSPSPAAWLGAIRNFSRAKCEPHYLSNAARNRGSRILTFALYLSCSSPPYHGKQFSQSSSRGPRRVLSLFNISDDPRANFMHTYVTRRVSSTWITPGPRSSSPDWDGSPNFPLFSFHFPKIVPAVAGYCYAIRDPRFYRLESIFEEIEIFFRFDIPGFLETKHHKFNSFFTWNIYVLTIWWICNRACNRTVIELNLENIEKIYSIFYLIRWRGKKNKFFEMCLIKASRTC